MTAMNSVRERVLALAIQEPDRWWRVGDFMRALNDSAAFELLTVSMICSDLFKDRQLVRVMNKAPKGNGYLYRLNQPAVDAQSASGKLTAIEVAIVEYVCKHRIKNGAEDLRRARQLIDQLIAQESLRA